MKFDLKKLFLQTTNENHSQEKQPMIGPVGAMMLSIISCIIYNNRTYMFLYKNATKEATQVTTSDKKAFFRKRLIPS